MFQAAPDRMKKSMLKLLVLKAKSLVLYLSGNWYSSQTQTEDLHLVLETWLLLRNYFCICLGRFGGKLLALGINKSRRVHYMLEFRVKRVKKKLLHLLDEWKIFYMGLWLLRCRSKKIQVMIGILQYIWGWIRSMKNIIFSLTYRLQTKIHMQLFQNRYAWVGMNK